MVTESTKKFRDAFALTLLGIVVLELVVTFTLLFKDLQGPGFSDKSVVLTGQFVEPVHVLLVVLAVVVTTHLGAPTRLARVVTVAGLVLLGILFVLGLITWIAALTSDSVNSLAQLGAGFEVPLAGKVAGTFAFLGYLVLTGLGAFFAVATLVGLPRPVRPQPQWQGQPQWGGQPQWQGQPQWGSQPQWQGQPQWGGQPQWQGQPQWGAQPGWYGQPEQQSWGQPEQQSWGQPEHQSWGQPEQQSWGQPEQHGSDVGATPAADETSRIDPVPPVGPSTDAVEEASDGGGAHLGSQGDSGPEEAEDDDQPGWWNPGNR